MICCGENRTTPFCPECGKQIPGTLHSLLAYLRTHQRQCEKQRDVKKERAGYPEAKLARITATINKWKAWADSVEQALGQSEE